MKFEKEPIENIKDHLIALEVTDTIDGTLEKRFEEMPMYKKLINASKKSKEKE